MPFAQNTQVTIIIQNNIKIYAYINSIFLFEADSAIFRIMCAFLFIFVLLIFPGVRAAQCIIILILLSFKNFKTHDCFVRSNL